MKKTEPKFKRLQEAFKAHKQVKFFYIAEADNKARFRVGFITELSATHVLILDTLADGPRKCLLDNIRGGIVGVFEQG